MKHLLKGQFGIITGGTRGIGRAICQSFAAAGASFAFVGRDKERGEALLRELKLLAPEGQFFFESLDVGDSEAVEKAVKGAIEEFGRLDFIVNNAGITRDKLLMQMTFAEWSEVLNTNLTSVYSFCHAAIRTMVKQRSGSIINISSIVGLMGNAGQTNYAAAKCGLLGFTRSLAKEVASRGLRVNAIAPGFIDTDMTGKLTDEQKGKLLEAIPLKRMGRPEEVADAALFLASHMSRYVTGQTLVVDGGMTA